MAQVLVTGGTGFIGRHVVARLLARGDRVRCLVRSGRDLPPGVEYVRGDVTVTRGLERAVRGAEVVYHLAGANLPLQRRTFWRVNAAGTRAVAETCARQRQPPIFIHVSSLAVAGPTSLDRPLSEGDRSRPVSEYGRSKWAGEQHLRAVASELPITILRPPAVFGPGDRYTIKIFRMARRGLAVLPGREPFQLSWIYVSDLVDAMLLAAERGQRLAPPGRGSAEQGLYYVAMDEHPIVTEATQLAAAAQGSRLRRIIRIPACLCRLAGAVNEVRSLMTGRAYWVNLDKLSEALAGSWTCRPDKAKRELGFLCRTGLAEGFRLTLEWYRQQGWC
jgi:nucleoside-diphosphate-sugar epimerase